MEFREATAADIATLIELVRGEDTVEDYPGEYSEAVFTQMLADEDTIVLVADDDRPIGFHEFKLDHIQHRAYLETVVVSNAHRGRGIATQLIREAERIARERGCTRSSFLVRARNDPMNMLAKKLGYAEQDRLVLWDKEL